MDRRSRAPRGAGVPLVGLAARSLVTLVTLLTLAMTACATPMEARTRDELARVEASLAPLPGDPAIDRGPGDRAATPTAALDGSLAGYVAHALAHSPELRVAFEEWRAASHGAAAARRFPELMIGYAGCVVGRERCVGPMGQRIGVSQWFPWPTTITRAAHAEAIAAEAAQRRFEAEALAITAEVARAYWQLWMIRRAREVLGDQRQILGSFREALRARVETGGTGLAGLAQVDLLLARLEDRIAAQDPRERSARAELLRRIGEASGEAPTAADPPRVRAPAEPLEALQAAAAAHPRVAASERMAAASGAQERAVAATRAPSFGLGADYIIGREATTTAPPAMHMLMLSASLRIPVDHRAIAAARRQTRAREAAFRAVAVADRQRALAELERALAELDDAARRVRLYGETLVPQAEAALGSTQGAFQAGQASLSDVLLVERDLLDLELDRLQAQVDHALAWADLEALVGRPIAAGDVP